MGANQISIRSKFFKIMMPGFDQRLKLPPTFCYKVKHEKSKRAILESCKGRWEMNVRREDDDDGDGDQILLEDGWPRFADEHDLTLGDFLVFEHTAKLHFNVVICNSTGCEKQFLDNERQTINPIYHANENTFLDSQRPCFSKKMSHLAATHKCGTVHIPQEFVRSNYLGMQRRAILEDAQGRNWSVNLYVTKSRGFGMTMGHGWHYFAAANNLEEGDLCTFQLNPMKSPTSKTISFHVCISRNTNR